MEAVVVAVEREKMMEVVVGGVMVMEVVVDGVMVMEVVVGGVTLTPGLWETLFSIIL